MTKLEDEITKSTFRECLVEESEPIICCILGVSLGLGGIQLTNLIVEWMVTPFVDQISPANLTFREWDALHLRPGIMVLLMLIGFAFSLSRIHPLIGRTMAWFSFFTILGLFYKIFLLF